jgi:hypothetical protein
MVDRETFDLIKKKHGAYASWAGWADRAGRPKSGMGDMSVVDPDQKCHRRLSAQFSHGVVYYRCGSYELPIEERCALATRAIR